MFAYFGYGSNINIISLRAKGVEPISSMHAILRGWRLKFNVKHWFSHEGGVGNIDPSSNPDDVVEGVVHECRDEDLAALDAMETYGNGYDRITVEVETEKGPVKALVYVGIPAALDDNCLPTQRYLNIIIKGAESAGISQSYIENLRKQPVHIARDYPDFAYLSEEAKCFDEQSLRLYPNLTALAGAVFDMQGASSRLDGLHKLFGGKDMTLFFLKRLDNSDGNETLDDVRNDMISDDGKKYLNTCLHEYAKEFKLVGRFAYRDT